MYDKKYGDVKVPLYIIIFGFSYTNRIFNLYSILFMKPSERKEREIRIGKQIAELLKVKFNDKDECSTTWGTKSHQGLGAVITRIVEEEVEQFGGKILDTAEPKVIEFPETMAYKMSTDPATGTPLIYQ